MQTTGPHSRRGLTPKSFLGMLPGSCAAIGWRRYALEPLGANSSLMQRVTKAMNTIQCNTSQFVGYWEYPVCIFGGDRQEPFVRIKRRGPAEVALFPSGIGNPWTRQVKT